MLKERFVDADLSNVFECLVEERGQSVEAGCRIEQVAITKLVGPIDTHAVDEDRPEVIRAESMLVAI